MEMSPRKFKGAKSALRRFALKSRSYAHCDQECSAVNALTSFEQMRQFSTTGPWGRIAKWKIVSHIVAMPSSGGPIKRFTTQGSGGQSHFTGIALRNYSQRSAVIRSTPRATRIPNLRVRSLTK